MHLDQRYGNTLDEIEADGFAVDAVAPMPTDAADGRDTAKAMGACMGSTADALAMLAPDMLLLLGDRFEMLAVAATAAVMGVPIAHMAGGEISEGAFDDSMRHAITKLSALHLTSTEAYRRRVIQMGEEPQRVFNVGSTGVYNCLHVDLLTKADLEASIGMDLGSNALLVTLHPATLDVVPVAERVEALCMALDRFPQSKVIFTYPNNDPQGKVIIDAIERYAAKWPKRVLAIPSLGRIRYLSALKYVRAVVGNSSSGIIEVPSMGIPTVDIGIRQRGRIAADSVLHCDADTDSIANAIERALQMDTSAVTNPYYKADTVALIADAIERTPIEVLKNKHFYDISTQ
jgi:UDP-hydrolysing UDP-N-acetyl-D-glucosamine 2-epimerase